MKNSIYKKNVFDCVSLVPFGGTCVSDNECDSGLACDNSVAGAQSFTCSLSIDSRCGKSQDCANNLGCVNGKCTCEVKYLFIWLHIWKSNSN